MSTRVLRAPALSSLIRSHILLSLLGYLLQPQNQGQLWYSLTVLSFPIHLLQAQRADAPPE